mgnify:FL=1
MIDKVCDLNKCTGCFACANACPVGAIQMLPGKIGHLFPTILDKCIECNKCIKTCPVNNPVELQKPIKTLAFWIKDDEEHQTSTSGGAAACFTNYILEEGGTVYGCASLSHGVIEHIRIDKKEDAFKLKGSKYVHSHINNTYQLIKADLKSGKKVLFIGLPCQVAGLKRYIGKENANLFAIDLICHGVPSQQVLFEYIESLGIKRDEVSVVAFREAKGYYLTIKSSGRSVYYKNECKDLYYMAFNDNLCFRDSCFTCRYSAPERVGDLTIGDFWGLGKQEPFNYTPHGHVSVVLVNNSKGELLMKSCSDKYEAVERSLDEAVAGNHNLKSPSVAPNAEKFHFLYGKVSIQRALKKCLWKRRMKAPILPIVQWVLSKI